MRDISVLPASLPASVPRAVAQLVLIVAGVVTLNAPNLLFAQGQDGRECDLTITDKIPLPDAGGLFYRRVDQTPEYASEDLGPEWRQVGLYGNGLVTRPQLHDAAGQAIAEGLTPIDGKIVMLSIGMSNTYQEFGRFLSRTTFDDAVNPNLTIINAAQGSRPADMWDAPDDPTWDVVDGRLADAGLTPDQVQIAWIKHAVRSPMFPPLDFPEHPEILQGILEDVLASLKQRYPNIALTYLSSRTRAYLTDPSAQSPEPASYEGGFAVQWILEKQIAGDPSLRYDGADPPAPWLSWGPYLWTDGTGAPEGDPPAHFAARSDGFIWTCADVDRDGVHPSPPTPDTNDPEGEFKIGDQLMAFFLTDNTTTPWFLRSTDNGPTIDALTANGVDPRVTPLSGVAPFTVDMSVQATGNSLEHTWTYDDGTFSFNPNGTNTGQPPFEENTAPTKVFRVPGTYDVRLAVRNGVGNTTLESFSVEVLSETTSTPEPGLETSSFGFEAFPNPTGGILHFRFRPLSDPSQIEIFAASGRRVAGLKANGNPGRVIDVEWNAEDHTGQRLAAGTYFAQLRSGGLTRTLRFVLTDPPR